ncbi:MAG TPA: hypothetical protein VFC46_18035 [Humisphaera sp.]|nr:hypothetical protein [Humisphaera sp.]
MATKKKTIPKRNMTGRDFDALSEAEKQRIIADIESKTPEQHVAESRPLNRRERAEWNAMKRQGSAGRPKLGPRGVKVIALSVERDLLDRADAYAKAHRLKRAEFFSEAVRGALG